MPDSDVRIGFVAEGQAGVGTALDFVRDKLQQHRMEMRQQMGMARMLGRELAMMGLDAKGAGGEVARLVAAFAVGGPFAIAGAAVGILASHLREGDKAAADMTKTLADGAKRAHEELQKVIDKLDQVTGSQRILKDLQAQRDLAQMKLNALEEAGLTTSELQVTGFEQGLTLKSKESKQLEDQIRQLNAQISSVQQRVKAEGDVQHRLNAQRLALEEQKRASRELAEQAALRAATTTAEELPPELARKPLDPYKIEEDAQKAKETYLRTWAELEKASEEMAKEEMDKIKKMGEGVTKAVHALAEDERRELEKLDAVGQNLAATFANIGTVFGGSAGKMLGQFGTLIQKAVQLAIAMSATGGPFAWVNIAATLAAITGVIASVPKFEAGTPYVPYTGLALVHQGERIVPADENRRGGGGLTVTINASALDQAWWDQHQGEVLRALSRAAGNRRTR